MTKFVPGLGILALGLALAALPERAEAQQLDTGVGANVSTAPRDAGTLRRPISRCILFQGPNRLKCESQEGRPPVVRSRRNAGR